MQLLRCKANPNKKRRGMRRFRGVRSGGGEIRTPERLASLPVFKTGARLSQAAYATMSCVKTANSLGRILGRWAFIVWRRLTLICKVSCSPGRRFLSRFRGRFLRWWIRRSPPGATRRNEETASVMGCKPGNVGATHPITGRGCSGQWVSRGMTPTAVAGQSGRLKNRSRTAVLRP